MTSVSSPFERRGQSMVEFALLAPAFFLLLLGVLDLGRVGLYYVAASDLARSGARYAADYDNGAGFTPGQIQSYLKTQANSLTMANLTLINPATCAQPVGPPSLACQEPPVGTTYYWLAVCAPPSCNPERVTVYLAYAFQPTTPMISALTGTIYVWGASTMDTEYFG